MLEGVEFVKLKGEELESGGVEGSEALEGDGVAWSLLGGWFGRLAGGVLESGGAWSLEGGGLVPGEEALGPGSQEGE